MRKAIQTRLRKFVRWWTKFVNIPIIIVLALAVNLLLGVLDLFVNTASLLDIVAPRVSMFTERARDDEILILVSQFHGTGDYDPSTRIFSELHKAAIELGVEGIRVERVPGDFVLESEANELRDRYNASFVVWGTYDNAGIEPRFVDRPEGQFQSPLPSLSPAINIDLGEYHIYLARGLTSDYKYLAFYSVGWTLMTRGDYSHAIESFNYALNSVGEERHEDLAVYSLYTKIAIAEMSLGHADEALKNYLASLSLKPGQPDVLSNIGGIYITQGQIDLALQAVDDAIDLDPTLWVSYMQRGTIRTSLGEYQAALIDFNSAIQFFNYEIPQYEGALGFIYSARAKAYANLEDSEKARADYILAAGNIPDTYFVYHDWGWFELDLGNFQAALDLFKKSLELGSFDPRTLQGLGDAYKGLAELDKAKEIYFQVIEMAPDYGGGYFELGILYLETGDYESAISYFTKTLEIWPDHTSSYINRADANLEMERYNAAIDDYTHALEIEGFDKELLNLRGIAYVESGKPNAAIIDLNHAWEINPNYISAYFLSVSYDMLGQNDQALYYMNIVIEDFGFEAPGIFLDRARLNITAGNYERAIKDCQRHILQNDLDTKCFLIRSVDQSLALWIGDTPPNNAIIIEE